MLTPGIDNHPEISGPPVVGARLRRDSSKSAECTSLAHNQHKKLPLLNKK
jgi:hypothetical protein